jgi:hypothetical protein
MNDHEHPCPCDGCLRTTALIEGNTTARGRRLIALHEALPNQNGSGGDTESLPSITQKEAGE